jgi:hypothetical protein
MAAAVIFNLIGLAMTGWGISMLLEVYPRFQPVVVTAITSSGLGMIALSTVWLAALWLLAAIKRKLAGDAPELVEATTTYPLPNWKQLMQAMENLQEEALDLIERRREIHHLNIHQWHYAHREETASEIEANKRYRQAKNALELERLATPTQFWVPLDNFCGIVEQSLAREVYAPPTDQGVYQTIERLRQLTLQQMDTIATGAQGLGASNGQKN